MDKDFEVEHTEQEVSGTPVPVGKQGGNAGHHRPSSCDHVVNQAEAQRTITGEEECYGIFKDKPIAVFWSPITPVSKTANFREF